MFYKYIHICVCMYVYIYIYKYYTQSDVLEIGCAKLCPLRCLGLLIRQGLRSFHEAWVSASGERGMVMAGPAAGTWTK